MSHVSREVKEHELLAFKMVRKLVMRSVTKKGIEGRLETSRPTSSMQIGVLEVLPPGVIAGLRCPRTDLELPPKGR